jgi:predicted CXXCH cytochrome family protein
MKTRIRTIRADGPPADVLLDVDPLRLGRGAALDLRGATMPPVHSEIGLEDGVPRLRARAGHSVEVGGRTAGEATLVPGLVFTVGTTAIAVLPPLAGEDLLLEVRQPEERAVQAAATAAVRRRLGSAAAGRSRRRTILAVVGWLAVLILAWPPGFLTRALRPVERLYDVGTIGAAHAHVAGDCAACHAERFRSVANASCQSANCHPAVGRHGRPERNARDDGPCTSCHREHDGPLGLVDASDRFCAGCHADAAERHPEWQLLDASQFVAPGGHGEFRPSVVVGGATGGVARLSLERRDALQEASGLVFSHAKHLVPGLRSKPGERPIAGCAERPSAAEQATLACGDCHLPDASGALMQPVSYRRHCQRCHDLTPTCAEAGYQLEHGAPPDKVLRELEAVLATGRPAPAPRAASAPVRRRLDGDLAPLADADPRGRAIVADVLGEKGLCALCHAVTGWRSWPAPGGSSVVGELAPVRAVPGADLARWMPLARFSHRPHVNLGDARRTDLRCTDCHDAPSAESSAAVLMPGIARCRECHGRATAARAAAPAGCVVCHRYHLERYGPIGVRSVARRSRSTAAHAHAS